jgi:hypothetical protein
MSRPLCTFCPEPATTGEHIWSDWLNALLGKHRRYRIKREIQGDARYWQSVGLHQKLPALCDDCNNNWGSVIETRMKDVSSFMVRDGTPTHLKSEDLATIALYSQLKAFVCDYAQEEIKSFYELSERRAFRNNFRFPSGTNMWLARTLPNHGIFRNAYAKPPFNTPKRFHTYVFTMSLGHLVIQLTSVRWTKKSNRRYAIPPQLTQGPAWSRVSVPIWPDCITPISWPPQEQLGREGLNSFFNRWALVNRVD